MKTNNKNLTFSIVAILLSLSLMYLGYSGVFETKGDGYVWGLAGGLMGPGLLNLYYYFKWKNRPEEYRKILEDAKLNTCDERNVMIRDKSGRLAYLLNLGVGTVSIWVFGLLQILNVTELPSILFTFMGGYVMFQLLSGMVIFNVINKKY